MSVAPSRPAPKTRPRKPAPHCPACGGRIVRLAGERVCLHCPIPFRPRRRN